MTVLTEIEAAHWARFARWKDFRAALRSGRFPSPDHELPDGPRWSTDNLEKWLRKQKQSHNDDEAELIERAGLL